MTAQIKTNEFRPNPAALAIDPELRLSLTWVIAALVCLGLAVTFTGELLVEPAQRLPFIQIPWVCFGLAALIWLLDRLGGTRLSHWFTVVALVVCTSVAFVWYGAPILLLLMVLPPIVASALLTWPVAVLTGLLETLWVLFLAPAITGTAVDPMAMTVTVGTIWTVIGLLLVIIRLQDQRSQWLYDQFQRARQLLDETRDQKVQLVQMQEDLKTAYQTQELLNQRLVALRQITEEAHQAKAAFVAKISHEFRTPLNMILGLIDTLVEAPEVYGEPIPPRLYQILEIVQRNSDHLAGLIDDVLDLSQAEVGRLALHREWVDLADELEKSLMMVVRPLLEQKELNLQISIADDFPLVYCDRTRVRQVVLNLVSNAAKYTEHGGITVDARRLGNEVQISVTDTGPGIAAHELERIFELFAQAGQSQPSHGASGLGLSISRQFIERHHGRIWAESELGRGSTFAFRLPIRPVDLVLGEGDQPPVERRVAEDWMWRERATWPQLPEMARKQRILICDENGELTDLFTRYVDDMELVGARNLSQAIDQLQSHPVHTLILNSSSPQDLVTQIEEARQALPDMPIVGCAFPGKIEMAIEAGAVGYLIKPVRRADLVTAIDTLDRPVKRLLIVDDDPDIRELYTRMLSIIDPTLQSQTAASGAEALAMLRRCVQSGDAPDLVLLDILMPDMSGWQVLAEKNLDPTLRDIPVITVSGEDQVSWPTRSPVLVATMGLGMSVPKLLGCSQRLSAMLLQPDGEVDSVDEST